MKKIILCFALCFLFTTNIFAQTFFSLGKVEGLFTNSFTESLEKKEVEFVYLDNQIIIRFRENIYEYGIYLKENEDVDFIKNSIAKYKEWRKTAIDNKVVLRKEINRDKIRGIIWSVPNGGTVNAMRNSVLITTFISYNDVAIFFVIRSEKLVSSENRYITQTMPVVAFEYDTVIEIEKILSVEHIENIKNKSLEKDKKNDELFQ